MKQKSIVFALIVILLTISMVSCGSSTGDAAMDNGKIYYAETSVAETAPGSFNVYSDKAAADYDYAAEAEVAGGNYKLTSTSNSNTSVSDTRKIIKTENLTLETKSFEEAVDAITGEAIALGGYVESSYVSGRSIDAEERGYFEARYANFTLRVPAAKLDGYVGYVEESYHVTSRNTDARDITDSYYDTESRLKSLLTQEERLLEMLEGATELQYMLQIEDKLADVRYQIENYHSTLSRYDKQVAMSTVNITMNEVVEYQEVKTTPKTFGERIGIAFTNSLENFKDNFEDFVIDSIYALPGLIAFVIFVAVCVVVVVIIVKKSKKKAAKRNAEKLAMAQQQNEALRQIKQNENK